MTIRFCCEECFNDSFLLSKIKENNKIGSCHYCGANDVNIISIKELSELFVKLLKIYTYPLSDEHYDPEFEHPHEIGCGLLTLVNEDWSIFKNETEDYETTYKLLFDILNSNKEGVYFDPNQAYVRFNSGESYQDPFMEWKIYWEELKNELKHGNRFFPFFQVDSDIFEVLKYCVLKKRPGDHFFIARIGKHEGTEMLGPPAKDATAGRANPRGISYLYCSDNMKTCISEVRPWKGSTVTIATVELIKDIRLVDLSKNFSPFIIDDIKELLALEILIDRFSEELSIPIYPSNSEIDYLPTQYLTELIKTKGYDGIYYKSAMGQDGYNIVLFDQNIVKVTSVKEVLIKQIDYDFLGKDEFEIPFDL